MERRGGDRRGRMRFEVVGDLVGSLQTSTVLYIRDISLGGALLESNVPLSAADLHRVMTLGEGTPVELSIRVARQTQVHRHLHLIGVEFVNLTAAAMDRVRRWVEEDHGPAAESLAT